VKEPWFGKGRLEKEERIKGLERKSFLRKAENLVFKCCEARGRKSVNGILNLGFLPLEAACLARESALSFPGISLWEGIHARRIEMLLVVME